MMVEKMWVRWRKVMTAIVDGGRGGGGRRVAAAGVVVVVVVRRHFRRNLRLGFVVYEGFWELRNDKYEPKNSTWKKVSFDWMISLFTVGVCSESDGPKRINTFRLN